MSLLGLWSRFPENSIPMNKLALSVKNLTLLMVLLMSSPACQAQSDRYKEEDPGKPLIAFGSCSRESIPEQMWDEINVHHPDLWIWLGDNIYGDTHDMEIMEEKYRKQKAYPGYKELLDSDTEIIGTWDDHDYGINDGGKHFSKKDASKKLMINFLDIPEDHPIHDHDGVYQTWDYRFEDFIVRVILLDTRYFRDTVYRDPATRAYRPNETGGLLGETQWVWLEDQFRQSTADLHLLGSSIQVIPEEHRFEKWANFPQERKRLFNLLVKYPDKKTVIISGDRHIAEISKIEPEGLPYPLYDVTSSGLTHAYTGTSPEPNQYRVSDLIRQLNFGLIYIDPSQKTNPQLTFEIRGKNNDLLYRLETEL